MAARAETSAGSDLYLVDELFTPEEREIRDRVRAFSEREVLPIINGYWERAEFPFELIPGLAALRIAGLSIRDYGCPGMSAVASGLVMQELARGDGSISTFFGVHSGLAMGSIALLGSEEQRERWLPAMSRLERIGAFALTEPDHGSDAVMLETRARTDGDSYVIDGSKRWIGNASFADVIVVWARDDEGNVGGFIVEKDAINFDARVIGGKTAKRASLQADIELRGVRVPRENRLAHAKTFQDTSRAVVATRYVVAWEALGHATAAFEAALSYARTRVQFGKPIASFQLVQNKLARMSAELTAMQLLCWRASQLADQGRLTAAMASLAKMNNAAKARQIIADARDLLGGNGDLLDYHVARHHADIEAVFTYEGTDSMQALILGRELTGHAAFAPR